MEDRELLRQFASDRSERAFGELVRRHVSMVYSVCRRQMRDAHLAEDVTQAVFIILAKKAATIPRQTPLGAWLFRTAIYTCANARRLEQNHQNRIKQVSPMGQETRPADPVDEDETERLIDQALLKLGQTERDVLILRFFEDMSVARISKELNISTYAVETKLSKSLTRLRRILAGKGLAATALVVASAMRARPAHAAPANLASSVTAHALAATHAAAAGPVIALASSTLRKMAAAKLKSALAATAFSLFMGIGIVSALAINIHMPVSPASLPSIPAPATVWLPATPAAIAELTSVLRGTQHALCTMDADELHACVTFTDDDQLRHWNILWQVLAADYHLKTATAAHIPFVDGSATALTPLPDFASRLDQTLPLVAADVQWGVTADRAVLRFHYTAATPNHPPGGSIFFLRVADAWMIDAARTIRIAIEGLDDRGQRTSIDLLPIDAGDAVVQKLAQLGDTLQNLAAQVDAGQCRDQADLRHRIETAAHGLDASPDRAFFRLELLLDQDGQPRITP